MNIQFEPNVDFFNGLTEVQISAATETYRDTFSQKLQPLFAMVDFDDSKIIQIKIIHPDTFLGWYGKVVPINENDELKFEILYQDTIFKWFKNPNHEKYQFSIGVIVHELYHCKEMSITSKYVNFLNLYFNSEFTTTYEYIRDFALHQFSEYYAHYYSSKIYSENVNFGKTLLKSEVALTVLKDYALKEKTIQLTTSLIDDIENYIRNCIIQLARYRATQNDEYIHLLDEYKNSKYYNAHYEYFVTLDDYLYNFFETFPSGMSEELLIEFGKKIFSIIQFYNLDFSTADLSDNYVLKYTKEP